MNIIVAQYYTARWSFTLRDILIQSYPAYGSLHPLMPCVTPHTVPWQAQVVTSSYIAEKTICDVTQGMKDKVCLLCLFQSQDYDQCENTLFLKEQEKEKALVSWAV